MPQLHVRYSKWTWVGRICAISLLIMLAVSTWVMSPKDLPSILLVYNPWWMILGIRQIITAYVLLDDVLAVHGALGVRYIPLSGAVAHVGRFGWTFRWKDGRRNQSAWTVIPTALRGPIQAVMAHPPENPARTTEEAAHRLQITPTRSSSEWVGLWYAAWFVSFFVAAALGFVLRSVLPVALPALMTLVTPIWRFPPVLAWAGVTLWVLKEKTEPYAIPLDKVTQMHVSPRKGARITTVDGTYPTLLVPLYSEGFVKAFERRLAGEPKPPTATTAVPEEHVLRCSLCGTPAPGRPEAAGAGVYICETCANRTRLEASDSGYGLVPKDPKPM